MGPDPGPVPLLAIQRAGLGRLSTSSPQPLHLFWAPGDSTARWDEGIGSWVCLPGPFAPVWCPSLPAVGLSGITCPPCAYPPVRPLCPQSWPSLPYLLMCACVRACV